MTLTDRRRSPALFAVIAALAVAGAVLGLLLSPVQAPVQAQETETLLSNTEQIFIPGNGVGVGDYSHAQGFTTGSNAPGYRLDSIELHVNAVPTTPSDVTVELWSATSDSEPDASVAALTHSTGMWATGANTFNAPTDTELDANTLYFVFLSYSGVGEELVLNYTGHTSADSGGASGWSVGQLYQRTQSSWSPPPHYQAIEIQSQRRRDHADQSAQRDQGLLDPPRSPRSSQRKQRQFTGQLRQH